MQAWVSPPPRWSFPVQQPELDLAPSSQTPSGGRPAAAKGLWVAGLWVAGLWVTQWIWSGNILRRKSKCKNKII